jgi:DinB superfamily
VADDLERLRIERGEGWEWTRIQTEPCPQCGDNPAALPVDSLGLLVVARAAAWREFLDEARDAYLRRVPEPGVFSPLQYAAHVRDILRVYTERIVLGLEHDSPTVPMFHPPQEVWEEYNRSDVRELGADLETHAQQLAESVGKMAPSDWSRVVVNDRGEYGVYTFTLVGLACTAAHEAHHHLLDARGTLSARTVPR